MHKTILGVVLMVLALQVHADVFKWVDRDGRVNYGDSPPANVRSRPVDLRFAGRATQAQVNPCCLPAEDARVPANQPVQIVFAAEPPAREPAPRGMDFGVFIMLRHGMTEGELLQRAGPPDFQSTDGNSIQAITVTQGGRSIGEVHGWNRGVMFSPGFTNQTVKNFYYYPTLSNPFTTVLTLTGGRITDLQRTRQF